MKNFLMCLLTFAVLPMVAASAADSYGITDLGIGIIPHAMNDQAQIAGTMLNDDGSEQGVLWQPNIGLTQLLPQNTGSSAASAINNEGWIVGTSYASTGSSSFQGFLWRPNLGLTPIDGTGGWIAPLAVNNQGLVGAEATANLQDQETFGVLWSQSNGPASITASNASISGVHQLNDQGQMVLTQTGGNDILFVAPGGEPITIASSGASLAMNNSGTVVGYRTESDGYTHAFFWSQQGGLSDILTPGANGFASGINDAGQIVGYETLADGSRIGFLLSNGTFSPLDGLLDSPGMGWSDLAPQSINNSGQIAGYGLLNGQLTGFLLTQRGTSAAIPAPEPATAATLLLAVPLLLRRNRRRI